MKPFIYGSLGGDDFPLVAAPPAVAPDSSQGVRHDYEMAERSGTRNAWDWFLSTYPEGFYAKLARAQRNKLVAEEARVGADTAKQQAATQPADVEPAPRRKTPRRSRATRRAVAKTCGVALSCGGKAG